MSASSSIVGAENVTYGKNIDGVATVQQVPVELQEVEIRVELSGHSSSIVVKLKQKTAVKIKSTFFIIKVLRLIIRQF